MNIAWDGLFWQTLEKETLIVAKTSKGTTGANSFGPITNHVRTKNHMKIAVSLHNDGIQPWAYGPMTWDSLYFKYKALEVSHQVIF